MTEPTEGDAEAGESGTSESGTGVTGESGAGGSGSGDLSAWVDDDDVPPPVDPPDGPDDRRSLAELSLDLPPDVSERVAMGVELLACLEHDALSMKEAVDRVESVTTDPALTREILETAEAVGAIERDGGRITPRRGVHVSFAADVVRKEGEFDCRRCGATLTEGHFIQFDGGEHGPFGSTCIKYLTGRK